MHILHRFHIRVVLFVIAGLLAIAVGAGLALASNKAAPIGTGVVVINTNLAYQNSAAAGTGMVLTSSGEILTNNHVISGATTIKVVIPNTGHSYTARVVGYSRTADVAILQLQSASNLKTISIGNSSKLQVGQAVTGLGNAGGTGRFTSATGVITGLGKSIVAGDESGGSSEQLVGLIETNAGIQAGDSGGPLLNSAGRVIGMDTAASTGVGFQQASESDAYAIPIGKALTLAKAITGGKASATVHVGATAFLGIQVESLASGGFGDGSSGSGALIAGVVSGGPADSSGLVAGDVITAINGKAISSPTVIPSLILTLKPGTMIAVTYSDQFGTSQTTNVTLGTGPAQ